MKWILIGVLLVVVWYIIAPLLTPAPLKGGKGRKARKVDADVIEGEGKIIE